MFREDHIVRQIAQATSAVTRILGLKEAQDYQQALAEVERAYGQFCGLNAGLVEALPAAELVELARWDELLDIGKLVVLADVLQAAGDIYAAQRQPAEAEPRYLKALELLLEVAMTGEHNRQAAAPRIAALINRLEGTALPEDLRDWLAHYHTLGANSPAGPDSA